MKKYYLIQSFDGSWLSGKGHLDIDRWGHVAKLTEYFDSVEDAEKRISELGKKTFYRIIPVYVNE